MSSECKYTVQDTG